MQKSHHNYALPVYRTGLILAFLPFVYLLCRLSHGGNGIVFTLASFFLTTVLIRAGITFSDLCAKHRRLLKRIAVLLSGVLLFLLLNRFYIFFRAVICITLFALCKVSELTDSHTLTYAFTGVSFLNVVTAFILQYSFKGSPVLLFMLFYALYFCGYTCLQNREGIEKLVTQRASIPKKLYSYNMRLTLICAAAVFLLIPVGVGLSGVVSGFITLILRKLFSLLKQNEGTESADENVIGNQFDASGFDITTNHILRAVITAIAVLFAVFMLYFLRREIYYFFVNLIRRIRMIFRRRTVETITDEEFEETVILLEDEPLKQKNPPHIRRRWKKEYRLYLKTPSLTKGMELLQQALIFNGIPVSKSDTVYDLRKKCDDIPGFDCVADGYCKTKYSDLSPDKNAEESVRLILHQFNKKI